MMMDPGIGPSPTSATFAPPHHPQLPPHPYDTSMLPNKPSPSPSAGPSMPPPQEPHYPSLYHPPANFAPAPPYAHPQQGQDWYGGYNYNPQFAPRPYPGANGYNYPPPFPQQYGAPVYQPYPYGPYPQMGDPGPSTMQNGFMPYSNAPVEPRQPFYPVQSDTQASSPRPTPSTVSEAANGGGFDTRYNRSPSAMADQFAENGHAQPPFSPPPAQPMGFPPMPNGQHLPPQQQSFSPSYPSNHPYASGGGVGYVPYGNPPPMIYPNGNFNPSFIPQMRPPPGPPDPGFKRLNPTAQGFTYTGRRRTPRSNFVAPHPDVQVPFASGRPDLTIPPRPQVNGHAPQARAPHMDVEAEKPKIPGGQVDVLGDRHVTGVLGLTQMNGPTQPLPDRSSIPPSLSAPDAAPVNESVAPASPVDALDQREMTPEAHTNGLLPEIRDTPALSLSSTDQPSSPVVQTPVVATIEAPQLPDAKVAVDLVQRELTFGGAVMTDSSPAQNEQTPRGSAFASLASITSPPVPSAPASPDATVSTLKSVITASQPSVVAESSTAPGRSQTSESSGNIYWTGLRSKLPPDVTTSDKGPSGEERRSSKKVSRKTSRSALRSVSFAHPIPSIAQAPSITFGSLEPSLEAQSETLQAAEVEASGAAGMDTAVVTVEEVLTPLVKPLKPVSWADLLRDPRAKSGAPSVSGTIRSDVASKATSPTQSLASLMIESSVVTPSVVPTSPTSTATLPPSSVMSPPPPIPATRAPINYAAAAAAFSITPQEELVRLMSDGVKGRIPDKGPVTMPRGLQNTGNMCFANTILQVLVYCLPFTQLLDELSKRLKADLGRQTPLLEAMIVFLREFNAPQLPAPVPASQKPGIPNGPKHLRKEKESRRDAFLPEHVYDAMKENKRFDFMKRGHQEDAEEFFGFLNDTLHEELLKLISRMASKKPVDHNVPNGDVDNHIARPVSPTGEEDGWLEVGKKQKVHSVRSVETNETAISRMFGGTQRSVLRIPGSKDSVTLEPFKTLPLDVRPDVVTIEDAIKHISEPETVSGVWSASRKENVDATRQVYIETFPPVLVLHLKRFEYDQSQNRVVKRDKPIAYGTELVVPAEVISPNKRGPPVKYRLFGVDYHHGASSQGGHYTLAAARQDGSGWIHFDDETYGAIPTEAVVVSPAEAEAGRAGQIGGREKCAYLLFYQRVR